MQPRVGAEFDHKVFRSDAQDKTSPPARMVVTEIKMYYVFFRYANPTKKQASRPGFGMDYSEFVRTYPEACEEAS